MKIADTVTCVDTHIYCAKPDDIIYTSVAGGGDLWTVEDTCANFIGLEGAGNDHNDWEKL